MFRIQSLFVCIIRRSVSESNLFCYFVFGTIINCNCLLSTLTFMLILHFALKVFYSRNFYQAGVMNNSENKILSICIHVQEGYGNRCDCYPEQASVTWVEYGNRSVYVSI